MLTITSKYPAYVSNALEQEPNLFSIYILKLRHFVNKFWFD